MAGRLRIVAVASGGGHWIELWRLRAAFEGQEIVWVSTFENYASEVEPARYYAIGDATRFDRFKHFKILIRAFYIMLRERPDAVITTGSAPALGFILIGRLMGAKTLWIDSIAQPEKLSTSGSIAKRIAHTTVSQWPEAAKAEQIECWGAVL